MAGGRIAKGYKVKYDDNGAGSNLTALTQIVGVKSPKVMRASVNGTHLDSLDGYDEPDTAGDIGWKKTEPGSFTCILTESQLNALMTLLESGAEKYWYFQYPLLAGQATPAQWKLKGKVSSCEPTEATRESDDPLQYQVEVTRTEGKPTFTQGS